MHTGNFESAVLPGNLRQDGVYMTNDRIPYAKKSTLPRRFSLIFPASTSPLVCSFQRRARFGYAYNVTLALFSLSLSLFLASSSIPNNIISVHVIETDGWYMETSNVTALSAVWKRSPFQFTNSSRSRRLLIKILKWQSIKRADVVGKTE